MSASPTPNPRLTPEAFDALAELLGRRDPMRQALHFVLVEGMANADAVRLCGVSLQNLRRSLIECRAGLALAERVVRGTVL